MKMLFGVVGLLIALAIVASVARKQLQAVGAVPSLSAASAPSGDTPPSVREQSQALQQQVKQDVERALQAAPARNDAAER